MSLGQYYTTAPYPYGGGGQYFRTSVPPPYGAYPVPNNPYFSDQLDCFVGLGSSYSLQSCARVCVDGVDCKCAKIENADGRGNDARECWANPHRAQAAGCQNAFYKQQYRTVCTCDESMCNAAAYKSNSLVAVALSVAAGFVARHF